MINLATQNNSTIVFIAVWKLQLFSRSLEETIELCDKLRRVGTRLVSTTERGSTTSRPSTTGGYATELLT